jgi:Cu/Ag efflux protein CusF
MSMTRTHQVQPSRRRQPLNTHLLRWIAQSLTAALVALALLSPAITYAAQPMQPIDEPGAAQQDDVLAGVDKFSQGAKESNEVTLDKNMLGLAGGFMAKKSDSKAKDLMKKMDSVMVRNYEYAAPGQYKMEDVEQVRKRLDGNGWSHLVKTHNATESTDVCVKVDAEGVMSEMVIIDAEPLELNFIHLRGHMSLSELSQMSGSFGGPSDPMLKQRPK